ncbi:MAG TPA: glycosyltransferase [Syntrophobacter fumaroxidans]|nr:glycosyltransferase [Syntrophobacter fumaroxidans]
MHRKEMGALNFSIVIPTYNRAGLLDRTLFSVSRLRVPTGAEVELVVVNNYSTDNTSAVVGRHAEVFPFPVREVVETQQGVSHGRNRGIVEGRHEMLVYLDDDVKVNPEWLAGCREAAESNGADYVVGPVFPDYVDGRPAHVTPRIERWVDSWYSRQGNVPFRFVAAGDSFLPGCNFAVRKAAAEEIGGFRPGLGRWRREMLAGEDTEFGYRLVESGKQGWYEPRCSIRHAVTLDKLGKPALRRRVAGLGRTWAVMEIMRSGPRPIRIREWCGGLKPVAFCLACAVSGDLNRAFELELDARFAWHFLLRRNRD